jgi:hypothetical protein
MINEDIRHIVEAELREGEKIIWADRPRKHPFSQGALFYLIFASMWTFAMLFLFFPVGVISLIDSFLIVTESEDAPSKSFSVVFTLMCLSLIFIGFLMFRQSIKNIIGPRSEVYGLTLSRGIIVSRFWGKRIASLSPQKLLVIERSEKNGVGTLLFDANNPPSQAYASFISLEAPLNAFRNIQNPRDVETLIYETFLKKVTL